jgi:outer membrane protein assembly factor BamB
MLIILFQPLLQIAYADWEMYQGDPSHTGTAYVEPVTNPQVLWHTAMSTVIYSSPVVSDGIMYLGADDNSVHAIDASTGAMLWRYNTSGPVISTPAVGYNKIFFGSDDFKVYAVDKILGTFVWSYTTGGKVESSPIIDIPNQILYIGSDDTYLYALNATTGALVWKYTTNVGAVRQSPALANGIVYVGAYGEGGYDTNPSEIFAVNATTGETVWTLDVNLVASQDYPNLGNLVPSSIAIANRIAYVNSQDIVTGTLGVTFAINATTGDEIWDCQTNAKVSTCPAVAFGIVYIGSTDGTLYALNSTTGGEIWHQTTGGAITASPVIALNVIYVGSSDYKLYAFDRTTGTELWSYLASSSIDTGIAVEDGRVYFFASDPQFYAVVYVLGNMVADSTQPSGSLIIATQVMANILPLIALVIGFAILRNPDEWKAILGFLVLMVVISVFAVIFYMLGH